MSDLMRLYGYYEDKASEAERPEERKQYEWLKRLIASEIEKSM